MNEGKSKPWLRETIVNVKGEERYHLTDRSLAAVAGVEGSA